MTRVFLALVALLALLGTPMASLALVPGGTEVTVYAQEGPMLICLTVTTAGGLPTRMAEDLMRIAVARAG